jgi:hypothetical protein
VTGPKQTDIGPVGLAAALHSTPEQILVLVRAGAIRADYVRAMEPRWRIGTLAEIIKQLLPKPQTQLDTLNLAHTATEALLRAEQAEYQGGADDSKA